VIRAEANGKLLHFDYDSMVGSNEVFKDRETGSLWQQTLSTATSGPLKGTRLDVYPFLLTQWGEWRRQHPDTLVLKPLPGYAEHMAGMNKFIGHQWSLGGADTGTAPKGAFGKDDRLKPREMVLGLQLSGGEKAYSLSALRQERLINDSVGGIPVVVVHQPASDTTTAFDPRHEGKTLKFQAVDAEADRLVDVQTHSSWNAYGLCLSGKLKGTQLKPLVLEPEFWFAWSEFHTKTEVYGLAARP
jgi:Protein of unknown function (DUF3179)